MTTYYGYPLPTRTDWQKIRAHFGVKQGAVSGVNLGASYEAASTTFALKTMSKHLVAIRKLKKDVETYAAKLPVPPGDAGKDAQRLKEQMNRDLLAAIRKHESSVTQVVDLMRGWDPACKDLIKVLSDLQAQLAKGGARIDQNKLGIPARADRVVSMIETFAKFGSFSAEKYSKPLVQLSNFPFARDGLTHENAGKFLVAMKSVQAAIKGKIG